MPSEATKAGLSPTGLSVDSVRASSASACAPYRDLITEALGRRRNARANGPDLVDDHSFTACHASVRRFVGRLRRAATP